jgi:hypothetical protein
VAAGATLALASSVRASQSPAKIHRIRFLGLDGTIVDLRVAQAEEFVANPRMRALEERRMRIFGRTRVPLSANSGRSTVIIDRSGVDCSIGPLRNDGVACPTGAIPTG